MTGKIKVTFEPKTIKYSPVSFELEVENEKEFMDFIATYKIVTIAVNFIEDILNSFKKSKKRFLRNIQEPRNE